MKCGARVALGVAGGYFLGRTKKMKLALMLAGWAAGRQAGGPGALLGQAKNLLGASPELTQLSDDLRGRLLEAGKGAALSVATRQVEMLTDRVAGRVEKSLSNVGQKARVSSESSDADERDDAELDEPDETYDAADEETGEDTGDERAEVGARSASDGEPASKPAPARSGRRAQGAAQGAGRAAKGGTRTAVRKATSAASGGRRATAAGRSTRAARRDDSG
jgi:hypothetical protein